MKKPLRIFHLRTIEGQMIAVLTISFSLLLAVLTIIEFVDHDDVFGWVQSDYTIIRLNNMTRIVESIKEDELESYIAKVSRCHDGFTLTSEPFSGGVTNDATDKVVSKIAAELDLPEIAIRAKYVPLTRDDFAFSRCAPKEIKFPIDSVVVSLQIIPEQWLNAEVHPHEFHFTPSTADWFLRSSLAFLMIGAVAVLFVRQMTKPLNQLTESAKSFGSGLKIDEVEESGPPDLKRAIRSFNTMQREVSGELERRINTLAAISHDVRSPLTALRLKAELIDDETIREDLIASIRQMDRITESALEYLKGESRSETKRRVNLGTLVESACYDFANKTGTIVYQSSDHIEAWCRPDALTRALRNLIENALKYGSIAEVGVKRNRAWVEINVSDDGPGIPTEAMERAMEPFERLSEARESNKGGFGLGLAIVKAVAEGHDGKLRLASNVPTGLIATIILPVEDT